ncbi:MAG: ADP-ribosylation factor-like protein [Promethearchaeia archaeon]
MQQSISELVKISIIGHPAVGKTTILKLLTQNEINRIYSPTQGFDLKTIKFGNYNLRVWDFGGQKAYLKMYLKDYLRGSDLVFIVTDSTPRNVLTSKELIDYTYQYIEDDCPIIAIANKQDLVKSDGRMNAERVEKVLQVKTIGLTAIERAERQKLLNVINDELKKVLIRRRLKE